MTNSSLRRKSEFPLNVTMCLLTWCYSSTQGSIHRLQLFLGPYLISESHHKISWKDCSFEEKEAFKKIITNFEIDCSTEVCSFTF